MPTIALNNSVSYAVLNKYSFDVQNIYPIRVWGTVGFIIAMWITDLTDWKSNTNQFVFASIAMIVYRLSALHYLMCQLKIKTAIKH
jgi:NHS family xanthosine MFS transporter